MAILPNWPSTYIDDTVASPNRSPGLTRDDIVLTIAPDVAQRFLTDDHRNFAEKYQKIVLDFKKDKRDHTRRYLGLLALRGADPQAVPNEHDFANVHRAVWLLLYETIVRLLNFNIHRGWGDPPSGGTSQGYDRRIEADETIFQFHNVPNKYGYFAVGTGDYTAPDTGIGALAKRAKASRSESRLTDTEIRIIATDCARAMVAQPDLGEGYLDIVKRYYGDRGHHTTAYATHLGTALGSGPLSLGDDDFANIHRAMWLFLVRRFECLVGENPFGDYGPVTAPAHSAPLPGASGGRRTFEVPNDRGDFRINMPDVDP